MGSSHFRNLIILGVVLAVQLLLVAYQLRRNQDIPLIRRGTLYLVTPIQKALHSVSDGIASVWSGYVGLWGARRENQELSREVNQLRLANRRLQEQVEQAERLQALLDLKQQMAPKTVAAQVISSGAGEMAHLLTIDQGQKAGIEPDMPVLVPDGIVGKVLHVFPDSAQVLLLTDAYSGVACLLEGSRVHGVLKGQNKPLASLGYVSNGEPVEIGQRLYTSGEDRIYPKGLPVGVVVSARPGVSFQDIAVQPLARLNRLEEVLVIVSKQEISAAASQELASNPEGGQGLPRSVRTPEPAPPGAALAGSPPSAQ